MRQHHPNQYLLPLDADRHELLATVRLLRSVDLGLSPGRAEGVVELLERLALLGNDLREDHQGGVNVRAQVIAIAARIDCRRTVADRTVRNWRADAEALGLLETDIRSQKFGRREWNNYRVSVARIRQLAELGRRSANLAGSGRKWPETIAAPRPETIAAPRPETIAAPPNCLTSEKTNDNQEQRLVVVVSSCGVGRAEEAVRRAIANGVTPEEIDQRVEAWRRLPKTLPAAQRGPGVLFNWLSCRGSYAATMQRLAATSATGPGTIERRAQREASFARYKIIRTARAAGRTETEIAAALAAAGLEY